MPEGMRPGIFVSYRRDDSRGFAGRLYDRLVQRFDPTRVFMDVDSIEPGLDFGEVIEAAVASCDVLLALIGPKWASAVNEQSRRLDDPNDLVVLEIQAALDRDIRVIPILIDGASMPRCDQLPPSLERLSRRNAVRLDHDSFSRDIDGIMTALDRILSIKSITEFQAEVGGESTSKHLVQSLHSANLSPWRAEVSQERGRASRTLSVRIRFSVDEHLIVARYTAWRDSLEVDGTRIASSFNYLLPGPYIFVLLDGSKQFIAELELGKIDPEGSLLGEYVVARLTINGQEVTCTKEP